MSVHGLARRASINGVGTPVTAPIRVDTTTNTPFYCPAGSGVTEIEMLDVSSAQVLSAKVLTGFTTVPVSAASLALTAPLHAGRVVLISALAGCAVTLPAATGTGNVYTIMRSVSATSVGDSFAVASALDFMRGVVSEVAKDDGLLTNWGTLNTGTVATESDTVTWNFTTTGISNASDWIQFQDLIATVWSVKAFYTANGAEATPFSAAV